MFNSPVGVRNRVVEQGVFEWVQELTWMCPKCGERYVTVLLNPTCKNCGFQEVPT